MFIFLCPHKLYFNKKGYRKKSNIILLAPQVEYLTTKITAMLKNSKVVVLPSELYINNRLLALLVKKLQIFVKKILIEKYNFKLIMFFI
ncbi:hypothetical protein [Spiroplasma poulsonii]|uniref:hypothetical protein n=1 Tax=Spiroplasma poulsonii TaxID=2138 RepID=UPI001F53EC2C|nr:hypothetical protein [Spiroplasma poulsonii]